jgi:hypothetical protein
VSTCIDLQITAHNVADISGSCVCNDVIHLCNVMQQAAAARDLRQQKLKKSLPVARKPNWFEKVRLVIHLHIYILSYVYSSITIHASISISMPTQTAFDTM